MKLIGLTFTHDYWQETYKSTSVDKGWQELNKIANNLDATIFHSVVDCEGTYYNNITDDIVTIYHNFDLTNEQKQQIAECVEKICTVKSNYDKASELHAILVVFNRKDESDCFVFNLKS